MRDVLDRIRDRVRVVIHRVDAPLITGAMMMRMADSIDRRIAQVHVRRGHIDFCAQDVLAILELACLHPAQQVQ